MCLEPLPGIITTKANFNTVHELIGTDHELAESSLFHADRFAIQFQQRI